MSCPICSKSPDPAYRPFCSKRCADVDLAKWFNESYRVSSPESQDQDKVAEADKPSLPRLH